MRNAALGFCLLLLLAGCKTSDDYVARMVAQDHEVCLKQSAGDQAQYAACRNSAAQYRQLAHQQSVDRQRIWEENQKRLMDSLK